MGQKAFTHQRNKRPFSKENYLSSDNNEMIGAQNLFMKSRDKANNLESNSKFTTNKTQSPRAQYQNSSTKGIKDKK